MKKVKKIVLTLGGIIIIGALSVFAYKKITQKTVAILLYENFTMLDVVGAYQTFPGLYGSGYRMKFVAKEKGMVKSSHIQSLNADYSLEDLSEADILFIPGGEHSEAVLYDEKIIEWIQQIDQNSEYTFAVASGNLLLGKTGALKDRNVAAPWLYKAELESLGARCVDTNYTKDDKYYTGKGASASIDMVLALINELAGEKQTKTMQLFIEYDPSPPVHSGMYEEADSIVKVLADKLANSRIAAGSTDKKTIVMFLYEGFTMLDMTGPYQVFKELAPLGYEMKFVAKEKGTVSSDMILSMNATYSIGDVEKADILFIPGGSHTTDPMMDSDVIDWIQMIDKNTSYTTSVCTGSLLYAKAGLLENKNASTHWYAGRFLSDYGTTYTRERYTIDGKYITGAGVSSGIDLALLIVKEVVSEDYAKAIQLKIGYHPTPPYDAGSPEKSGEEIVNSLSKMLKGSDKKYKKALEK